MAHGEPLQSFTAIARVMDDNIFQVSLSDTFKPFRRKAEYFDCTETLIRPIIDELEFIENKKSWGFKFRFGLFQINESDFRLIAARMNAGL